MSDRLPEKPNGRMNRFELTIGLLILASIFTLVYVIYSLSQVPPT